ncbi:thioesterase family protein, partial [candidate division KSB1 bacterium]|nr:thioesterase family protein [candidate division KSB1 bacterium]
MSENKTDFDELIQQVETIFVHKIPFNKLLGMHVESLDFENATIKIEMRDELIGNFIQKTLHGGVTSSVLDVIGGLTAFMTLLKKMEGASSQEKLERLAKFGT